MEFENRRKAIRRPIFRYRPVYATWNLRTAGKPSVGQYSAADRLYYLEFENRRKAIRRPIFRYRPGYHLKLL